MTKAATLREHQRCRRQCWPRLPTRLRPWDRPTSPDGAPLHDNCLYSMTRLQSHHAAKICCCKQRSPGFVCACPRQTMGRLLQRAGGGTSIPWCGAGQHVPSKRLVVSYSTIVRVVLRCMQGADRAVMHAQVVRAWQPRGVRTSAALKSICPCMMSRGRMHLHSGVSGM